MSDPASETRRPVRWGGFVALTVGVGLLTALTLALGLGHVWRAARTLGWAGFLAITGWWLIVVATLGAAWMAVAPGVGERRFGLFVWARLVREAASDILPFSQVGGLVIGGGVAIAAGLGEAVVWASLVADLTTEMAAQLLYTLGGLAGLAAKVLDPRGGGAPMVVLWGGAALFAAGVVLTAAFALTQRRAVGWMARAASRWLPDAARRAEGVADELTAIYRRPGRVAAGIGLHAAGWVASGAGSWLTLQLMGAPTSLVAVLTVESLMYAVRAFGFAIPGALGVQEGAYAVIGPLFGVPPETALALSLIKRARDVAIGAPTLLIWRALGARRLLA